MTLLHVIAVFFVLFTNNIYAETDKILITDYLKLCTIYSRVDSMKTDLATKEMNLTEDVYNKLPVLFNNLFKHIIRSNAHKRYELIRQYAKQQNNYIWECESARLYYINNF